MVVRPRGEINDHQRSPLLIQLHNILPGGECARERLLLDEANGPIQAGVRRSQITIDPIARGLPPHELVEHIQHSMSGVHHYLGCERFGDSL